MKRRISIIMILLMLNNSGCAKSLAFSGLPYWLSGKLCMNVVGTSDKDYNGRPLEQYIAMFNFDEKSISTIQVPMGSRLQKDFYSNEAMVVIKNYKDFYGDMDDVAFEMGIISENEEIEYSYFDIDCIGFPITMVGYGHMNDIHNHLQKEDAYSIIIDKATKKLQLGRDSYTDGLFLRRVVISDLGDISYENDFLSPIYAISSDGKIAFSVPIEREYSVEIIDDNKHTKVFIPDNIWVQSMCWLDSNTLILVPWLKSFADLYWDHGGMIQKYDYSSGIMESASELWKGEDAIIEGYPVSMSINDNHTLLAVLVEKIGKAPLIQVINLTSGERYDFAPFEKDNDMYCPYYAISQSGVLFYSTDNHIVSSITWY